MGSTMRIDRTSGRRALAAAIAAVTAAALLPFVASPAAASGPRDNDLDEFCSGAPEVRFGDESSFTAAQEEAADCVAATELNPVIAEGFKDGTFRPDQEVLRDQMASFIARMLLNVGVELPADPTDHFTDDENSAHELRINQLASLGVVSGRTSNHYAPTEAVRRDQMAKFINNAIGEAAGQTLIDTGGDDFVDDCDDDLEPHVNALAEANIVQGVGADRYACDSPVTRGQMVLFLARTLDYLAEHGEAENPFQQGPFEVTGIPTQPEPGERIVATVDAGEPIARVEIDGCGLTDHVTTTDEDTATAGFQVMFTIPSSQPTGDCTLVFTVTTSDGDVLTHSIDVTIVTDALTVTGVPAEVTPGQTITATVDAGEPIARVEVDGCGLTDDVTTADEDPATGFQTTFTIPATQGEGACTLVFEVTTSDGDVLTDRVAVIVVAAAGNQDLLVQPTDEATLLTSNSEFPDRGRRFFEASGLDDTKLYVVAIFPTEYVSIDASEVVRFLDLSPSDGVADYDGSVIDADIELVNGSSAAGGDDGVVVGVSPIDGKITFVIDSESTDEVRPVVFHDRDGGSSASVPDLDLDAEDRPTEDFGVGGITTWIPPEQETGTIDVNQSGLETLSAVDVEFVDKDANVFVGCELSELGTQERRESEDPGVNEARCSTFEYDSNDHFQLNGTDVSFGVFESRLSPGDNIEGTYDRDAGDQSRFDLTDDAPLAPASATVTETATSTLRVDFTESATPTVDEYFIYRTTVAADATACPPSGEFDPAAPGTYTRIAVVPDPTPRKASGRTLSYEDDQAVAGTRYCYAVTSIDDGDESNTGTKTEPITA